jgi:hypothetical protein
VHQTSTSISAYARGLRLAANAGVAAAALFYAAVLVGIASLVG